MSTSGTDTYAPNRAEVIQDALAMCGHDVSDGVDPAVAPLANRALNALIKALNVNRTDVNVIVRTSFNTVAGDDDYATDALGVDGMIVAVSDSDYPVMPMSKAQYDAKVNKQSSGRPSEFYHDRQAGVVYLYPCPDSAYSVTYGKVRQYYDMNQDEETFDLPSSAVEMLKFGLAHRMSYSVGLDIGTRQDLENQFRQAERRYIVANSAYTKGQVSTSAMVV